MARKHILITGGAPKQDNTGLRVVGLRLLLAPFLFWLWVGEPGTTYAF